MSTSNPSTPSVRTQPISLSDEELQALIDLFGEHGLDALEEALGSKPLQLRKLLREQAKARQEFAELLEAQKPHDCKPRSVAAAYREQQRQAFIFTKMRDGHGYSYSQVPREDVIRLPRMQEAIEKNGLCRFGEHRRWFKPVSKGHSEAGTSRVTKSVTTTNPSRKEEQMVTERQPMETIRRCKIEVTEKRSQSHFKQVKVLAWKDRNELRRIIARHKQPYLLYVQVWTPEGRKLLNNGKPMHLLRQAQPMLIPVAECIYSKTKATGNYHLAFEDKLGEHPQVYRIKLPECRDRWPVEIFQQVLVEGLAAMNEAPVLPEIQPGRIVLVKADADKVTIVRMGEKTEHLVPFSPLRFHNKAKLSKRLTPFTKPWAFSATYEALNVLVLTSEEDKDVLDGCYLINRNLRDDVVDQKTAHVSEEKIARLIERLSAGDPNDAFHVRAFVKEGSEEQATAMVAKAKRTNTFHGVVTMPDGTLKGQGVVSDPKVMNGYDIITHECNVKPEITGAREHRVMLQPEKGKTVARTNLQLMTSFPWAFPSDEVSLWMRSEILGLVRMVLDPKKHYFDNAEKLVEMIHEKVNQTGLELYHRCSALELVGNGFDFTYAPELGVQVLKAHFGNLMPKKRIYRAEQRKSDQVPYKLSVKIPCSSYEAILPASVVESSGRKLKELKENELYRGNDGFAYVSDDTARKMPRNHGGSDWDDKFIILYRMIEGKRRAVVFRNPSDVGDFSIFDLHPASVRPPSILHVSSGPKILDVDLGLPEMKLPMPLEKLMEQQTSRLEDEGKLVIDELPKPADPFGEYGIHRVLQQVRTVLEEGGPGLIINLKDLCNLVTGKQLDYLPCTKEGLIDGKVQTQCPEAQVKILQLQARIENEIWKEGETIEVDSLYFESRNFQVPEDCEVKLVEGFFTRQDKLYKELTGKAEQYVRRALQKAAKGKLLPALEALPPVKEEIQEIAAQVVKDWRKARAQLSYNLPEDPKARKVAYQTIDEIVTEFLAKNKERISPEQFIRICYETPTSSGLINESIVFSIPKLRDLIYELIYQSRTDE